MEQVQQLFLLAKEQKDNGDMDEAIVTFQHLVCSATPCRDRGA